MNVLLKTAPTLEPISLAELKLHLNLDSGTFDGNLALTQSIAPGSHAVVAAYDHYGAGVDVLGHEADVILSAGTNLATGTVDVKIQESDTNTETITLDVAPATDWAADDVITGQTSGATCIAVLKLTALTYTVKNRSGLFTLGEIIGVTGVVAKLADQGAAKPTFSGSGYTDWTGGAFTQVTTANDNADYKKQYTGSKQYIRTVAKVLLAACTFGTSILGNEAVTADDANLADLITEATGEIEDSTSRKLLTQTWYYYLDAFPSVDFIKIPFGNLQSTGLVITYKDSDGTTTTMTLTTDYLIETNGEWCGRIVLPYGVSWPSFTPWPSQPIRIEFVCGWTTAALLPRNIVRAIKLQAENSWYHGDRREILEPAIRNLLRNYRIWDEL